MASDGIENFLFYKPVIRHFSGLQFLWKITYKITEDSLKEIQPFVKLKLSSGSSKWKAVAFLVALVAVAGAVKYRRG